jgi:lipopolysaccharide export system protein LptA
LKSIFSVLFLLVLAVPAPAAGPAPSAATVTEPPRQDFRKYIKKSDPIDIKSDRLEAHNKERKVIFEGNVQARQSDVLIFADRLTTYYDKAGKDVDRIVAEGSVKITQADKVGTSREAVFENQSRKIVMMGDPHLWQGKDELRGDEITVYLDEDRVLVEKARGVFSPSRVKEQQQLQSGQGASK